MDTPELEAAEPSQQSHVERYFRDLIIYNDANYNSLFMTSQRFLMNTGYYETDDEAARTIAQLAPEPQRENSETIAAMHDQFLTLPLRSVAPYIEAYLPLKDAAAWYEKIGDYLLDSRNGHGLACIEAKNCVHGRGYCPPIVLSMILSVDIRIPDFNGVGYRVDPKRTSEFALRKYDIGTRLGLIPYDDYTKNTHLYKAAYRKNVRRRASNP